MGFTATLTNEVGGIINGNGTLDVSNADFTNVGNINPGRPWNQIATDILTVVGDYTMNDSSVLTVDILGKNPGSSHDQLIIDGKATLKGTLEVILLFDFTPILGDSFEIITYQSYEGAFTAFNYPELTEGLSWLVNYEADKVILTVATDTDGDGISDSDETNLYGTNPELADTDGDGLDDGAELAYWGSQWNADPDGDELITGYL